MPEKKNKDWACSWSPIADHLDSPGEGSLARHKATIGNRRQAQICAAGRNSLHDSARFRELAAGYLRRGQALLRSNLINSGQTERRDTFIFYSFDSLTFSQKARYRGSQQSASLYTASILMKHNQQLSAGFLLGGNGVSGHNRQNPTIHSPVRPVRADHMNFARHRPIGLRSRVPAVMQLKTMVSQSRWAIFRPIAALRLEAVEG